MADEKWSSFPAASSVADADYTAIVQGGVNKRSAFSVIKAYIQAAFDAIYVPLTRTLTINGTAHDLSVDRSWTVSTATAFTDLTDVPGSYTGQANKIVTVKGTEDGLNFTTAGSTFTPANLTDAGTDGITVTGGTNAVNGSGTSLSQHVADATHNGYLSSTDWGTFNGKQAALSFGDLTDAGTDGIIVTGGTGSVIGSGTSIAQHVADASHNGYLSSTDWSTFNGHSTVTPAALTKTNDTNVTLTLGGTPTTALLQASSIGAGWAGTLSQARGGFGKSTASTSDGQIPIGKTSDGSWNVNTITAGAGIAVTNGAGAITIAAVEKRSVTFVVNGSGIVLTSGTKSYVKIPYGGTLQGWLLIGSPSGSITVDIFRSADGAGLPVTSIVGAGVKPSLSSAVENSSTSFTSWTSTTLTAKDNLAIDLSGATNTYLALTLYFQ